MRAEKIIRLRMQNSTFCRRIPVVQGDTARTFRFILEDITLDGTEHARIYARKPSGAEVYDECEVVGSNEVIFTPETEQIFIETGIILAEIRVAKGEKLITSYSFEFEVRQSTMRTGDIPSSDEFNALERAIEEAKGLHEPEFTEAGKRENIVSGETMQILFGKIKKWFTDLGALITKIGNKDISSIGDGTVTGAITDLDKRSTKNTSDIDVERKRIDNIAKLPAGSTTGDAELKDIRVGADGTIHGTAGEAVRQQVGSLKEDIVNLYKSLGANNKVLKDYLLDGRSTIKAEPNYHVYIFNVIPNSVINVEHTSNSGFTYAFFYEEPTLGSVSYNGKRVVVTNTVAENVVVPSQCRWIAVSSENTEVAHISPNAPMIITALDYIEAIKVVNKNMLNAFIQNDNPLELKDFYTIGNGIENLAMPKKNKITFNSTSTNLFINGIICKKPIFKTRHEGFYILAKGHSILSNTEYYLLVNIGSNLGTLYSYDINADVTEGLTEYSNIKLDIPESSVHNLTFVNNDDTTLLIDNGKEYVIDYKKIAMREGRADIGYFSESCIGLAHESEPMEITWYLDDVDNVTIGKYIAFGDSMTYGSLTDGDGSHLIGRSEIRYPEYYANRHNMYCLNKGVPGQGYLNYGDNTALDTIKKTDITDADLITLSYGLNDHTNHRTKLGTLNADNPNTILGRLKMCLEYIWQNNPKCKIIVIGSTTRLGEFAEPILKYGDTDSDFNTQGLNKAIETYCNINGIAFISNDGCGVNAFNQSLRCDVTHFTEEGYLVWSKYLSAKIGSVFESN